MPTGPLTETIVAPLSLEMGRSVYYLWIVTALPLPERKVLKKSRCLMGPCVLEPSEDTLLMHAAFARRYEGMTNTEIFNLSSYVLSPTEQIVLVWV